MSGMDRLTNQQAAPSDGLREALEAIRDGYGPNHLSKYARDVVSSALSASPAQKGLREAIYKNIIALINSDQFTPIRVLEVVQTSKKE